MLSVKAQPTIVSLVRNQDALLTWCSIAAPLSPS
jgi:hypothetical protein